MATVSWIGGAAKVAKVVTCTVGGTVEVGDEFTCTLGTKSFTHIATSSTLATVADAIATAWNALSATEYPAFAEITAAGQADGTFTLTAETAGVDFSVTLTTTESGGGAADAQTFEQADTTANAGPNDYGTASNWSGNAVPVVGDDVVLENSTDDILYGLAQSPDLTSFTKKASFTGDIGLPRTNASGYAEYRDQYLQIDATTVTLEQGDGDGSGRVKIDSGSVLTALTVYGNGTRAETDLPAILWKGTHASNTVTVNKGDLGIAVFAGETATVLTLMLGYVNNPASDAKVLVGSGVTLGTVNKNGGDLETLSDVTTVNQSAGTVAVGEDAAVTTLNLDGGRCRYNSSGTLAMANISGGAVLDFRQDGRGRTVTHCNVYEGGSVFDPAETVTWTEGIDLQRRGLNDGTLDVGEHFTLSKSTI